MQLFPTNQNSTVEKLLYFWSFEREYLHCLLSFHECIFQKSFEHREIKTYNIEEKCNTTNKHWSFINSLNSSEKKPKQHIHFSTANALKQFHEYQFGRKFIFKKEFLQQTKRTSHRKCSIKKVLSKDSQENTCCVRLQACSFIKKSSEVVPVNFAKTLWTPSSQKHLRATVSETNCLSTRVLSKYTCAYNMNTD